MRLIFKSITFFSVLLISFFSACTFKKKAAIKILIPLTSSSAANSSVSGKLTSLVPSTGALSPSFSSTVYSYTMTVGSSVSSIQFTPTASDSSVSISINGTSVSSGTASSAVSLTSGTNTVTVTVGVSVTYTITITRTSSSASPSLTSLTASPMSFYPTFSSATTSYAATVSNSVSSITLTPAVSDTSAVITVNGAAVASGSASSAVSLSSGNNSIPITVTAADGSVTSYTLTVYRLSASQRRLFVTAASYNGNLGGPTGADTKCNADSSKPTDGSIYKAVLSDAATRVACSTANCTLASENIGWALGANLTYLRVSDGASVFLTNSAGIFILGTLSSSIDSGGTVDYWTSINANWTSIGSHCSGWTTSAGSGRIGTSDQTNSNAIFSGASGCSNSNRILCAEQ